MPTAPLPLLKVGTDPEDPAVPDRRAVLVTLLALPVAACARRDNAPRPMGFAEGDPPLHPGETGKLRLLINHYADLYRVPRALFHRVIQRESGYRPDARHGPYYGLMQILPQTAAQMGYVGPPSGLLDADTNLRYAGKYLRGAWLCSDGDIDAAVGWYARGYYYEAKRRGILVETGLRSA